MITREWTRGQYLLPVRRTTKRKWGITMQSRKGITWASITIAIALVISAVPTGAFAQDRGQRGAPLADAQAPTAADPAPGGQGGRGNGAPQYTPAAGAKDLKAVLFNWAWYMGMLRSSEEYDLHMSLEYQGKGTMQVDGQPCNVTKYRTSISYQTSGERIQITGTRPNGQNCSNIEVLSGAYTWNEDIPGAELTGKRQSHSDAGNRRGADDSPLGKPAGRVQGRIRRDLRLTPDDSQTAAARRRCDDNRENVCRMGRQQAGVDVSDPWRSECHGDRHTRRQIPGRERRREEWREHVRVHVQRLQGLEQSAESGRRAVPGQDD